MKGTFLAGIVLIIIGVLALVYQGFNYTKRERVLDIGPIHADADKTHSVWVPPLIGVVVLIGGVACLIVSARKA